MKMKIEWHQNCLENKEAYLKKLNKEMERLLFEVEKLNKECDFYLIQIKEALKQGKDEFDRERFLKDLRKEF